MESIFANEEGQNAKLIGSGVAIALLSVALDIPIVTLDYKQEDIIALQIDNSSETTKLIKDPELFKAILQKIPLSFSEEGARNLINNLITIWMKDIRLANEIEDSKELWKIIFELGEFIKDENFCQVHRQLFVNILRKQHFGIWNCIRGDSRYQLMLINDGLGYIIVNEAENPDKLQSNALRLLEFSYAIEDLFIQDPNHLKSSEIVIQVISRWLNLLDKLDLIYISTPSMMLFDDRLFDEEKKEKALICYLILLKLKGILVF